MNRHCSSALSAAAITHTTVASTHDTSERSDTRPTPRTADRALGPQSAVQRATITVCTPRRVALCGRWSSPVLRQDSGGSVFQATVAIVAAVAHAALSWPGPSITWTSAISTRSSLGDPNGMRAVSSQQVEVSVSVAW